jgi:hypothetical protein
MEPTAPILIVDRGVGSLCQPGSLWMEALVGWIQRWPCPAVMVPTQRSLASRSLSMRVVVDGGNGGMELTAPIIVIDNDDGGHCRLHWRLIAAAAMAVFVEDGHHQQRRRWDGANRTAPIVVVDGSGKDAIAATAINRRCKRRRRGGVSAAPPGGR